MSSSPTVYCPECGAQNDEFLERCSSCAAWLDSALAEAASAAKPERPFDMRAFGSMAGIAVALILLAQVLGATFSIVVLPASDSMVQHFEQLDALVQAEVIEAHDATALSGDLVRDAALREQLDAGLLQGDEAMRARERVRPAAQSVVLGLGGYGGLLPPWVAMLLAAVATVLLRGRRGPEVAAGAGLATAVQLLTWIAIADFELAAVLDGDLIMLGAGPGFAGPPIMLLGMTLVLGVGLAALAGHATSTISGPATKQSGPGIRFRGNDDDLAQLGPSAGGVTLASSGASELLCLRCARTYPADQCPHHPHEPLLDPRVDAVRYQLMDLDAQAGTSRFSRWTSDGLGIDAGRSTPTPTGPLLCMACARSYEQDRCPVHPDEPLLDPSQEAVRLELIAADDRARARASIGLMFGATAVALLMSFALGLSLDLEASIALSIFAGSWAGLIAVSRVIAPKLAPPRFSAWTGEAGVDLDEFGMGARDTIFSPIVRALERARQRLLHVLFATAVGAAVGSGLGLALNWPIAALAVVTGVLALLGTLVVLAVTDTAREAQAVVRDAKRAWNDPYASDRSSAEDL